MKIEWSEDTAQGTQEHPVWTVRGAVGGVAVEVRHDVTLNTSTHRMETMRLGVLDGIRAGLGLHVNDLQEEDIESVSAAMGALRRMALKAEQETKERLLGLTLEFATGGREATEPEPDTIDDIIREWEARGGRVAKDIVFLHADGTYALAWKDGYDEDPDHVSTNTYDHGVGGWVNYTLADLRRTLGLEVKP